MLWAARVLARAVGTVWESLSRLRRRSAATDPAEELRIRLAEARARDPEPVSAEPLVEPALAPVPEPDQAESEPAATDLEDLRRDVHARARALSDEMRGANDSD
jgi:hypothetical protein